MTFVIERQSDIQTLTANLIWSFAWTAISWLSFRSIIGYLGNAVTWTQRGLKSRSGRRCPLMIEQEALLLCHAQISNWVPSWVPSWAQTVYSVAYFFQFLKAVMQKILLENFLCLAKNWVRHQSQQRINLMWLCVYFYRPVSKLGELRDDAAL